MDFWIIFTCVIAFAVLLCFLLAIANHSGEKFMDEFDEMNKIPADAKLSATEFIEAMYNKFFTTKLEIVQISTLAGDAYSKGKLFLSGDTLYADTLASYSIIAHEMGHALQDQEGNKLKKLRFLRKLGRVVDFLMMPSLIAGIVLLFFDNLFTVGMCLICLGLLVFLLAFIVKLMTIAIEKDASTKAEMFLKEVLTLSQVSRCKRFLLHARMTYWAEFLRLILFWTGFSRKTKLF